MTQQCKCGMGHVSRYDGKCGHCRTKKEQKTHQHKLLHDLYKPEKLEGDAGDK